jgi:hypothetical protein
VSSPFCAIPAQRIRPLAERPVGQLPHPDRESARGGGDDPGAPSLPSGEEADRGEGRGQDHEEHTEEAPLHADIMGESRGP